MFSWSCYFDISGQIVRNDPISKKVTVSGVAIGDFEEASVRDALRSQPLKWRDTSFESANQVLDVILGFKLPCAVFHSTRRTQSGEKAWSTFWEMGDSFHSIMASIEKGKVGFVKPGTILRYLLFGKCSALLNALLIEHDKSPQVLGSNGRSILRMNWVFDTDIQGDENQETYDEMWRHWGLTSRLPQVLNISPLIGAINFSTEENDSLLLLPDYLAGCFHWSKEMGTKATFCQSEIEDLKSKLVQGNGPLFREYKMEFSEKYPLKIKDNRIVRSD